jgi:hypothetical protein
MTWPAELIECCPDTKLGEVVTSAIHSLLARESQLLVANAHERTICAHLACYLKPSFPEWDVDIEYNRHGLDPKKIGVGEEAELVYPDLIIHRRGKEENLLVVELKKGDSPQPDERDVKKLRAYRLHFAYKFALFLRLSTLHPSVTAYSWVEDEPHP